MNFWRYLFPGFVIGPVVASALFNLANGTSAADGNELGVLGLFIAGVVSSIAFFAADAVIKN